MKLTMIIPDEVIFGVNDKKEPINYKFIRELKSENDLINFLKYRLDAFFVEQVDNLFKCEASFALSTMTCVGIETLGEIFITNRKDDQSYRFVEISKKIDQKFGHKLSQKYEDQLKNIWSEKDLSKINNYGKILYRFFRNTMVHGYQAKGVHLSYEDCKCININEKIGFILLNPGWFWLKFKDCYAKLFLDAVNAQPNNPNRINCLDYIQKIIQ